MCHHLGTALKNTKHRYAGPASCLSLATVLICLMATSQCGSQKITRARFTKTSMDNQRTILLRPAAAIVHQWRIMLVAYKLYHFTGVRYQIQLVTLTGGGTMLYLDFTMISILSAYSAKMMLRSSILITNIDVVFRALCAKIGWVCC